MRYHTLTWGFNRLPGHSHLLQPLIPFSFMCVVSGHQVFSHNLKLSARQSINTGTSWRDTRAEGHAMGTWQVGPGSPRQLVPSPLL